MKSAIGKKSLLSVLIISTALFVSGQTDFHPRKYTLVSGKERQPGAVYRFASVRTGIDALVTIEKITKTVSLDALDFSRLGFAAAFQPELSIAPHCWGEIQFRVQYVLAGANTPAPLTDLPAKRKAYNFAAENSADMKLFISRQSSNSIKVILYMANFYGRILTRRAEVFLQKSDYEKIVPGETASIGYSHIDMGN